VFRQRTFVGLDVHARSAVGHALDEHTGEVWQQLLPRSARHLGLVGVVAAAGEGDL
jgi:hypothetical protein